MTKSGHFFLASFAILQAYKKTKNNSQAVETISECQIVKLYKAVRQWCRKYSYVCLQNDGAQLWKNKKKFLKKSW